MTFLLATRKLGIKGGNQRWVCMIHDSQVDYVLQPIYFVRKVKMSCFEKERQSKENHCPTSEPE